MAQTYDLSFSDIVNRFALLKSKIPNRVYRLYKSTAKNLGNIIEIQREAKLIMDFVGLGHLVPIVTFCAEKGNKAGHIELSDYDEENCVFIYITEDKRPYDNEILAVLAHEICHKVLKVNGVYFPMLDMENEIYTDLATIYMGLGLLTLNGCYSEHEFIQQITSEQTQKRKETHFIGYLTYKTYAIAFSLVNAMEGCPSLDQEPTLSLHAKDTIQSIHWMIKPLTADSLRDSVMAEREEIASRARYISEMEHYLHAQKCKIPQDFNRCNYLESTIKGNRIENPYQVLQNLNSEVGLTGQTSMFKDMLLSMAKLDKTVLSDTYKVLCPNCLKKFQNQSSANGHIMVECPHCNTRFIWDNSEISFPALQYGVTTKKESFFKRIFKK